MLILHAKAFVDGAFVPDMAVRVEQGKVTAVSADLSPIPGEETLDAAGKYLLPGFVDVHIHAFRGHDVMEGEEAVRFMSREMYKEGVAAFCPTTMSASVADTRSAVDGIRAVMEHPEAQGAKVLGAHMEAPFLQDAKCGAQLKEYFMDPSVEAFDEMTGGHDEAVSIITLAPERKGAEAFIRAITARGVAVSIGHTSATAAQTHEAADWGATRVTHTFNAQTPLHHRDPGVPGASLVDDRIFNEMICDGIHLNPDVIRLIVRAKGIKRAVMITDAMEAAGMPEGKYALGGQDVYVKDGAARLASGTLAGSILTMPTALRNMIVRFGFTPEDAVTMCTSTPADSIGETVCGRLAAGSLAPVTLWNEQWEMEKVITG